MRNLGGAVGIAVCGAVLNERTNFHFQMLASHITAASGPTGRFLGPLTARLGVTFGGRLAAHQAALRALWTLVYQQAETLSFADAFRAVMLAFAVATCLVPLMRKVRPAGAASGH